MINTSLHQIKKPEKIERDSRGTFIEEGHKVAFNRSGDVVIGKIKELKRNEWKISREGFDGWWWSLLFELIVIAEDGKESTIKNPNSFVII